jgi:hypothetical protein
MASNVISLHPRQPSLAGYLRVGHDGHRLLEHMLKAGRLQHKRFVFDAAYIDRQTDLLRAVKAAGCEVVLDTNFSEMFYAGKFASPVTQRPSKITQLPWANHDRPWQQDDFVNVRNFDVSHSIAEFAVKYGVDAVLLSSNILRSETISAIKTDCSLCESLRMELDKSGGNNIRVDFLASFSSKTLNDGAARKSLIASITGLPIDNIWLRLENFGATSTGVATLAFISAVQSLHIAGMPLVIDYAGGLVGLSTLAFGAAGGICHGIGVKETFDLSHWKKAGKGGGKSVFVYVAELDKKFKPDQLTNFFSASGSKPKFACNDKDCCGSPQDMIDHHDEHFIVQRSKQLAGLAKTPSDKRSDTFLVDYLGASVRKARASTLLKLDDVALKKSLIENKKRLTRLEEALVTLNKIELTKSKIPEFRGGKERLNVVLAS